VIAFDGQVVIVSGAASGQGRAEAELVVSLGARAVVADVDLAGAHAVTEALSPDSAIAVDLDVADPERWRIALETALDEFGRVDALVNNAGIFLPGALADAPAEDFMRMIAVNQLGTYYGLMTVGGHLAQHGGGSIVNVASTSGLVPAEGSALYGATKAAVINLTKGAALEWGPRGVRVNAVLPGGVDTRLMRESRKEFFRTLPLGRLAQPIEIARAVAFFVSDASSYCTGETLLVDGGWSLGRTEDELSGRRRNP
jgi:3alpha(or 20beta)-hydroxysteroid dehydrogenase